jgi:2-octaprenyl-6-methoxyphenol hydroxylase
VIGMIDVAIIGGALNGLTAALALAGPAARTPVPTVVIDRAEPQSYGDPARDRRASAITAASRRMLIAIGVWEAIAPQAQAMRRIAVTDSALASDGPRPVLLHFEEDDQPGEPAAFMVENHHLHQVLYAAARSAPEIDFITGHGVVTCDYGEQVGAVGLADGTSVRARLVVAADGRNSRARAAAGIAGAGWSYGQSAIVTTIAHDRPHDGVAVEHFLPAGPFAVLPLTGNRSAIVWTEATETAAAMLAASPAEQLQELQARVGEGLGTITMIGGLQSFPLDLFIAESFIGQRLALIGDAAHVIHPIAGLGFNLGMRDAAALAEVVVEDARLGLDHGAAATLRRYQAWRRFDTMMVAAATDGLNRLFSNDNQALRLIRSAGLRVVDQLSPARAAFMREAAGLTGTLPRLLSGMPL